MKIQISILRKTKGRILNRLFRLKFLILNTKGQRTGIIRSVALLYMNYNGNYAVVASNGGEESHPGWYYNILGDKNVEIELFGKTIPSEAFILSEEEKEDIWPHLISFYKGWGKYQENTTRDIPVVLLRPLKTV